MTTPNETKMMPERIVPVGSDLYIKGGSQIICEVLDRSALKACDVAAELARRWNAHSVLSQLVDYAQHAPVCRGPGVACDCGLKQLQEELKRSQEGGGNY